MTGPTALDGDVSTQGAQTFNSAVTLGAATVTLNSTPTPWGTGRSTSPPQITGGTDSLALTSGSGNQTLSGIDNRQPDADHDRNGNAGHRDLHDRDHDHRLPAPVTTNGTLTLGQATISAR